MPLFQPFQPTQTYDDHRKETKLLLNPCENKYEYLDEQSRAIMLKTIGFFEQKGKKKLKSDYHDKVCYADFTEL